MQAPKGLLFMSMESHGGMISTGENTDSSTEALWNFYKQSHLVANKKHHGVINAEFWLQNISLILIGFFNMS
jgi:hypothetical protein